MNQIDQEFMEEFGFQYIENLGQGGYGIIYKIYVPQYNQIYALKKIPKAKFSDTEIKCMIAIESNNIVPLYKYFKYDEFVYLLMEFCPDSLDKIIKQCQKSMSYLTVPQIYALARGMATSLVECHERNIIHGDVKPSNFLIDNYGRVKICDFGLSHVQTGDSSTLYSGTILFCAPEILKKKPYDGYKADVWAFGVTLFVLATNGECPWQISSKENMLKSIHLSLFDDSNIPDKNLKDIIKKCLKIEPNDRPTMKEILNCLSCNQSPGTQHLLAKSRTMKLDERRKICKPMTLSASIACLSIGKYSSSRRLTQKTRRNSTMY